MADTDEQLKAIEVVANATGAEMAEMSAKALKLGHETSFSAKEAARGMQELVDAGARFSHAMRRRKGSR